MIESPQHHLSNNPKNIPPQPLNEIQVMIPGPIGSLEIKYHQGSNQNLFVMCHPHPLYQGTMENKVVSIAVKAMADLGFSTVRFNYRGVGQSEGSYGNGIGECEDLLAVVEWARQNMQRSAKLYLGGFSLGVMWHIEVPECYPEKLLMLAPAILHMDFDALPIPAMPWVVIQGEADEVVSAEATYEFAKKHQDQPAHPSLGNFSSSEILLKKMPGVGHFFHGQLLALKALIQEFYAGRKDEVTG